MSGHTPGPWATDLIYATVSARNETHKPICALLWPTPERSESETRANARLISAAPEMLAALQNVEDALVKFASNAFGTPPWDDLTSALKAAQDAIDKAEGRE